MEGREFDVVLAALRAKSADRRLSDEGIAALERGDGPDGIAHMLGSEAMRGYACGLASAMVILDGADPDEEFEEFRRLVDDAIIAAKAGAFRDEVERYSEGGEG